MNRNFLYIFVLLLGLAWSCEVKKKSAKKEVITETGRIDLNEIKARGKLRVVTAYNSVDYFIYKGHPIGYQLELIQELSNHLGLKLDISVSNDVKKNFDDLLAQEVDLIAMDLTITRSRANTVAFSEPHCFTRQVLVQRKHNKNKQNKEEISNRGFSILIRNQLDLAGKSIYVQENSSYAERLRA